MKYLAILFILFLTPLFVNAQGEPSSNRCPKGQEWNSTTMLCEPIVGTGPGKDFGKPATSNDYMNTQPAKPGTGNPSGLPTGTGNPSGMGASPGPGPGTLTNQTGTGPGKDFGKFKPVVQKTGKPNHPFSGTMNDYSRSSDKNYRSSQFPQDAKLVACSAEVSKERNIYPHQTTDLICSIGGGAVYQLRPEQLYDNGFKLITAIEGRKFIIMYFDRR